MSKRNSKPTSEPPAPLPTIDPRSADVVLEYVEGAAAPSGIPARDLSGSDLARIVYVRAVAKANDELDMSRPQDDDDRTMPTPKRPGLATTQQLAKLAADLTAGGAFALPSAKPGSSAETTSASEPEA